MKWALGVALLALSGCQDSKPKHYYVLCEAKDWNGWDLVYTEKRDGYLIGCTYQSPDRKQTRIAQCDDSGCD